LAAVNMVRLLDWTGLRNGHLSIERYATAAFHAPVVGVDDDARLRSGWPSNRALSRIRAFPLIRRDAIAEMVQEVLERIFRLNRLAL
jgi:hypothetical protein